MNHCEHIKQLLLEGGAEAIEQQTDAAAHLHDCAACQRLLAAWNELPDLLQQLPEQQPEEALLQSVRAQLDQSAPVNRKSRRRFLAPSLASAAVLLAAIGLSRELLMREIPQAPLPTVGQQSLDGAVRMPRRELPEAAPEYFANDAGAAGVAENERISSMEALTESAAQEFGYRGERPADERRTGELERKQRKSAAAVTGQKGLSTLGGAFSDDAEADELQRAIRQQELPPAPPVPAVAPVKADAKHSDRDGGVIGPDATAVAEDIAHATQPPFEVMASSDQARSASERRNQSSALDKVASQAAAAEKTEKERGDSADNGKLDEQVELSGKDDFDGQRARAIKPAGDHPERRPAEQLADQLAEPASISTGSTATAESLDKNLGADALEYEESATPGFDFLRYYQQTEGLRFQPATGYWANTYIPGDPEIHLLSARLAQSDRSWLPARGVLEQSVEPVQQPFDAPDNNALSLNLMSDTRAIGDGAQRLRLQVGLRGIEHRRGQRPAINLAVVMDLPADVPDPVRIRARALLDALLQNQQAGDEFSLVVAGPRSLIIEPADFRFGHLQQARQLILGPHDAADFAAEEAVGAAAGAALNLAQALERAGQLVQAGGTPGGSDENVLGARSILLITASELRSTDKLIESVHQRARSGITLSVLPLGHRPEPDAVDQLVLAGLGQRRFLESANGAQQLIQEELHAASRAVARAARLSIRLAPGVQLVNVVGSQPLDARRAQRVRDIEHSMDQRLSTSLGIQADRGEDEQGIQIVIPAIYSADSVTVLLDLVTDRPGAIAEVSLRYKDLVYLRNGSLQAQLELPAGQPVRGPAELSVLKNLLTHHFIETIRQAATALGHQQPQAAVARLRDMHATITRLRQQIPAWSQDAELAHDLATLDRYIAALADPRSGAQQSFLSDSLRLAAWVKTHGALPDSTADRRAKE